VADPYQLGFSPDGKLLVVNGLARNQVDIYEAGSMKLVKRFPLPSMPSHLAYTPDGSIVFISLQGTGRLAAIDLKRMSVLWDTDVGKAPAGVIYANDRVLVAIMGSDNVAVVDPVDGRVERRIRTGKGAHQLFRSPDGKIIYVNNRVEGTTVALDAATLAPVRTYRVPGGPDDIAFAPDGKLWITERFAEKVAVLDPMSGAIEAISVGRSPHGIFLNTDRQIAAR
jgi:DNA-binding beta-propeller fold protein YncE